jgi:membrane peptidoglycan carboxypeptidase
VNDQPRDDQSRDDQSRAGTPSWPTGNDPDAAARPPATEPPGGATPGRPSTPGGGQPRQPRQQPPRGRAQGAGGPNQQGPIRPTGPAGGPGNQPTRAVGMPGAGGPPRRGAGGRPPGGRPGGPAGPVDRATDHLPPVRPGSDNYRREPDLLTHRDDDYLMDQQPPDDYGPPSGYADGPRSGSGYPKRRKGWRWVRRTLYVLIFLGVTSPIAAFYLIYQNVTVPDPQAVAFGQAQPVTIYYANGQVMDKLTTGSRIFIKSNTIPVNVRHAVEAAEDETFETNNGFDVKAIARTVFNQLSGGTGGGSTITQEYIKVATGNNQHSLTRKVDEVAEAYKMTKTYTNKSEILAAYLNIVYFGRGANGIESAARAFYGVPAAQLTPEQSAVLAGMIQLPGDANDRAYEQKRFTYVWGRMEANHWITPAQYKAGKFPVPKAESADGQAALPWDRQLIVNRVLDELATNGWSENALKAQGAQIYTTIQPRAQTDAEKSISTTLKPDAKYMDGGPMTRGGEPVTANGASVSKSNPQVKATEAAALVSVNPSNGEIVAWYGGDDPKQNQADEANLPHQAGSSFKPYVFAAGLEKEPDKIGLNAMFNPKSPQTILGHIVHNSDGEVCPAPCTVKQAMTESINTVFYNMGAEIGTPAVQKAAFQAGIPKTEYYPQADKDEPSLVTLDPNTFKPVQIEGGISIGQYPVRPVDQAQGYATLANNGMYIPAHFVRKVTDISGQNVLYQFNTPAKPAFGSDPNTSAAIARTVSDSMTDVAQASHFGLDSGRPADSKTGTQNFVAADGTNKNYNSDAWTIGFTPQVVTAVWFGHYDKPGPLVGSGNDSLNHTSGYNVFGREEPAAIWKSFMDSYLKGQPQEPFPTSPADVGGSWNFITGTEATTPPSAPPSQPDSSSQAPPTHTHTFPTNPFNPPPTFGGGPGGGPPTETVQPPPSTQCGPLGTACTPGNGGNNGGPPNNPNAAQATGGG